MCSSHRSLTMGRFSRPHGIEGVSQCLPGINNSGTNSQHRSTRQWPIQHVDETACRCAALLNHRVSRRLCFLCVARQNSSSTSSSSSRSGRGGKKKQGEEGKTPPVSAAARDVARRLGVRLPAGEGAARRRVPVTVIVNDVRLGVQPAYKLVVSAMESSLQADVVRSKLCPPCSAAQDYLPGSGALLVVFIVPVKYR